MTKKLIRWRTLWDLINAGDADYCMKCEHRTSADGCFYATRPLDCPIWASLEDAPDVDMKRRISDFINNWEPRESGHHGGLWYACQELRGIIGEPGCNCDECNYGESKTPGREEGEK